MGTSKDAPLRHTLIEYSKGRIRDATLWRALFTYRNWLVPEKEVTRHYRQPDRMEDGAYVLTPPGNSYLLDQKWAPHPKHLWLFSDPEAAFLAKSQGLLLGLYFDGFSGTEIFGNVNPAWEGIMVNPGSPQEETWFIPAESFPSLASFAETFLLEDEFSRLVKMDSSLANSPAELSRLVERLRTFPRFEVPLRESTRMPLVVSYARSPLQEVVVCTWPDCVEAAKASLPPDQGEDIRKVLFDGATIFNGTAFSGSGVIAINPFGPGSGLKLKLSDASGPYQILNVWAAD